MKNKNCVNRLILTNDKRLPIALLFAKGTAHDTNFLIPLLDKAASLIDLPINFIAHADKGFDSMHNRWQISTRQGISFIPIRNHGYKVEYEPIKDRIRPAVERSFSWINAFKSMKTIATKHLSNLYENTFFVFSVIAARFLSFKNIKDLTGNC